jgi:hypothetical protein
MEKILKAIADFLYSFFGAIRDKERNAENKEAINDKVEKANDRLKDMSLAERDAILKRLHRRSRGHRPSGGNGS